MASYLTCVDLLVSTQWLPEHVGSDAKLLGSMWDPALPRPLIPRVDCVGDLLKDHGVIGEEQLHQWVGWGRGNEAGRHLMQVTNYICLIFQGTENCTITMPSKSQ